MKSKPQVQTLKRRERDLQQVMTTAPALIPWKRYVDSIPEPDRSVLLHDLQFYVGHLVTITR